MFIGVLSTLNSTLLKTEVKLEEPLKILKASCGSSPGVDISIHVKK
jgi:hypothetical protein